MNSVQRSLPGGISCRDIINRLPQNAETLSSRAIIAIFRNLRNVQSMTKEHFEHPKFQSFLDKVKETVPQLSAHELSFIATDIMNHELLLKHEINNVVHDALMINIRDLTVKQMLFVDIIIQKTKSTDFYREIQRKIQVIFLERIGRILNDNDYDFGTFNRIAHYMNDHTEMICSDMLKQFSIALLHFDEYQLKIGSVRQLIMLYSKFIELNEQSKFALGRMVNVWKRFNPTLRDVELLLFLLLKTNGNGPDKPAFEQSGFIAFILDLLNKSCGGEVFKCYEHLIEMVFIL